jgi:hypothetical protein
MRLCSWLARIQLAVQLPLIVLHNTHATLLRLFAHTHTNQAAAREDRRMWQQRLQGMEQELQSNKLHIQQLMQQLHTLAAKQVAIQQPERTAAAAVAAVEQRPASRGAKAVVAAADSQEQAGSDSKASGHTSSKSSSRGSNAADDDADASSVLRRQPQQQQRPRVLPLQAELSLSPLTDATNRGGGGSSTAAAAKCSKAGVQHGTPAASAAAANRGSENCVPQAAARQEQQEQEQQKVPSAALLDVQRRMQELQARAQQLEAENAGLKAAHAETHASLGRMRVLQQAEQLKQVRGVRCALLQAGARSHCAGRESPAGQLNRRQCQDQHRESVC